MAETYFNNQPPPYFHRSLPPPNTHQPTQSPDPPDWQCHSPTDNQSTCTAPPYDHPPLVDAGFHPPPDQLGWQQANNYITTRFRRPQPSISRSTRPLMQLHRRCKSLTGGWRCLSRWSLLPINNSSFSAHGLPPVRQPSCWDPPGQPTHPKDTRHMIIHSSSAARLHRRCTRPPFFVHRVINIQQWFHSTFMTRFWVLQLSVVMEGVNPWGTPRNIGSLMNLGMPLIPNTYRVSISITIHLAARRISLLLSRRNHRCLRLSRTQ